MNKKTAAIIALLAATGVAWWSIFSNLGSSRIDTGLHRALGEASARQIAAALRDTGRVVLVDADLGEYKILAPINAAQIAAFKTALRRTRIEVVATEKVLVAAPSMARNGIFMQPGQLADLIARHSGVDAIVLFVGLSGPEELQEKGAQGKRPKLMVLSNYDRYYKSLLQNGRLDLAIVPNPEDPPTEGKVGKIDEWFERHYRMVTPANAAQLSD